MEKWRSRRDRLLTFIYLLLRIIQTDHNSRFETFCPASHRAYCPFYVRHVPFVLTNISNSKLRLSNAKSVPKQFELSPSIPSPISHRLVRVGCRRMQVGT